MSYMGVDIGTTGCKAVAFSADGAELAGAYREYPLLADQPGWAELDPDRVCDDVFSVIRETAVAAASDPVRGLAVSSQGEAFTAVDANGAALSRAFVSSDVRSVDEIAPFAEIIPPRELYAITGHTGHPLFTLFKLLWLKKSRPEVWCRAARFLCFEDLLHLRLGLEPAISASLAGRTMLFDVCHGCWSKRVLDALELDAARLARPLMSGAPVGEIPDSVAQQLGLTERVMVVAGGHDQVCAALGAGVVRPGQGMYAAGTVECLCPIYTEPRFDDTLFDANLCCYPYTVPGLHATLAYNLTGGNLLKWFRDQWSAAEKEAAAKTGRPVYQLILDQLPEEPSGLLALPYFGPSGTPHFDPFARSAIVGLTLETTRAQVLKALLECISMEMQLNMDILRRADMVCERMVVTGGGARCRQWNQLRADIMGLPITRLKTGEAGCFGAAMLACAQDRDEPVTDVIERNVSYGETCEPNPNRAAWYSSQLDRYRRLYPALKPLLASNHAANGFL